MLSISCFKQWWLWSILLLLGSCQWFELKDRQLLVNTSTVAQLSFEFSVATGTLVDNPMTKGIASYGHCWDTLPNPNVRDNNAQISVTDSLDPFVTLIGPLDPATQYYVRAFVRLTDGTISYGEDLVLQTLTTEEYINALIRMESTSNVTATTVDATGTLGIIVSRVLSNITEHGFCWSTTNPNPTLADDSKNLGAPSSAGRFTTTIDGLTPNTPYFIRAYVKNNRGDIGYSLSVLNFTTSP